MQIIRKIKNAFITTLELAQVRLQMMSIELIQLKNSLITTLVTILVAFLLLLVAFISLLFGLDNYLEPQTKINVFFSISAGALFLVVLLIFIVLRLLKKQSSFMSGTILEIQRDVTALKNIVSKSRKE